MLTRLKKVGQTLEAFVISPNPNILQGSEFSNLYCPFFAFLMLLFRDSVRPGLLVAAILKRRLKVEDICGDGSLPNSRESSRRLHNFDPVIFSFKFSDTPTPASPSVFLLQGSSLNIASFIVAGGGVLNFI